jgi:integrase
MKEAADQGIGSEKQPRDRQASRYEKITDKLIKGLELPDDGQTFIRDTELDGFGLRLTRGGASFVFEKRIDKKPRRITIGSTREFDVKNARQAAYKLHGKIVDGRDPSAEIRERKERVRQETVPLPTFGELEKAYFQRHAPHRLRESTQAFNRMCLQTSIPANWRARRLADITREDIERLHASLGQKQGNRGGTYVANNVLRILRSMFSLAVGWKMLPSNPADGVKQFKEHKRTRWLKPEELGRLNAALLQESNWQWRSLFPLLLHTGARLSEVLFAEWANVDLNARTLRFPMTKDGEEHVVPLSKPALAILSEMPSKDTDSHLFPGATKSGTERAWQRIRTRADLEDVRIHDLRHTFASWMAGSGHSLPVIGKALNHAKSSTTERYAHIDLSPVREAMEQTAALMAFPLALLPTDTNSRG